MNGRPVRVLGLTGGIGSAFMRYLWPTRRAGADQPDTRTPDPDSGAAARKVKRRRRAAPTGS